jgi:hypothetical protein
MVVINPFWLSGFVDGRGSFYIGIDADPVFELGFQVLPEFRIICCDEPALLYSIRTYFRHGVVFTNNANCTIEYRVREVGALYSAVIPFFERYPLYTRKKFDFYCFRDVIRMMERKEHLTLEGLEQIKKIKSKMNKNKDEDIVRT